MITCDNCGKTTNQNQETGSHWICGDCKVDEPAEQKTDSDSETQAH
ncbi:hypothetical protein [Aneurinibacillus uraniidurans]|nr:hypothetical protein [Aneurinibacillus sp. B1]WCN36518.1 hypothetical protein PO771_11570 [Aneurinibacillus sp. B1]